MRGANIFVTGGTGFFGKALLRHWHAASRAGAEPVEITVLSRDPDQFLRNFSDLDWFSSRPTCCKDALLHACRCCTHYPVQVGQASRSRTPRYVKHRSAARHRLHPNYIKETFERPNAPLDRERVAYLPQFGRNAAAAKVLGLASSRSRHATHG